MGVGDLARLYLADYNTVLQADEKRQRSKTQKTFLATIVKLTATIVNATNSGSFEECLIMLKEGQMFELNYFDDESQKSNIFEMMEMIEIGEVHYRLLADSPKTYRDRLAAGFQKRDRIPPERVAPKDGMHHALASYGKHLNARHSPMLAEEESALVAAMVRLTGAMGDRYYAMQRKAMGIDTKEKKNTHAGNS